MAYIDDFRLKLNEENILEPDIQKYMEEHTEIIPITFLLGHGFFGDAVFPQFEVGREKFSYPRLLNRGATREQ